jgi:excisionase family DNA binding protein
MDALDVLGMPESPLLTVEEAARVLRIGRSLVYQLAAEYRASGGLSGIPVIPIGGCLRVPRWALLELVLTGRVIRLCDADVDAMLASSGAGGEY